MDAVVVVALARVAPIGDEHGAVWASDQIDAAEPRVGEFYQVVGETLQQNLDRLGDEGIPVDVVFEQGADVLGL